MRALGKTMSAALLVACTASPALARAQEAPKNPRGRLLGGEQVLAADTVLGGAIEVEVEALDVDATTPAFLNGVAQDGLADLHFQVQLRYAAPAILGGRNAGEFVPYQKVRVQITNTSTASADGAIDIELAPHVGHAEGWHYASNVLLPPFDDDVDPFNATYHVTVTVELGVPVMLHADSMPASSLFTMSQPIVLFDQDVVFGGITTLPVGDVDEQIERVQAYADIETALDAGDFSRARTLFEQELEPAFEERLDPASYDAARGLSTDELADLLLDPDHALLQEAVGPDCVVEGLVVPEECEEWAVKGIARFFYLSVLHELDDTSAHVAEGDLDAADGAAHTWDEAWAYFEALGRIAEQRDAACLAGRFGAGTDCRIAETVQEALLEGSSAILVNGGGGLVAAKGVIDRKLVQLFYLSVVHEIIAMREEILEGEADHYNVARVEARAFYRTIAYLAPGAADALLDAALEDRQADLGRQEAIDLVRALGDALDGVLDPNELADPEVMP